MIYFDKMLMERKNKSKKHFVHLQLLSSSKELFQVSTGLASYALPISRALFRKLVAGIPLWHSLMRTLYNLCICSIHS